MGFRVNLKKNDRLGKDHNLQLHLKPIIISLNSQLKVNFVTILIID